MIKTKVTKGGLNAVFDRIKKEEKKKDNSSFSSIKNGTSSVKTMEIEDRVVNYFISGFTK